MRLFIVFVILAVSFIPHTSADMTVNVQNNFGYTIVDVSEAMDMPEYSNFNQRGLVDWDQFNYRALIQVLFDHSKTVSLGPEVGFSRLYYWEEKYVPFGFSPRWRWDTIWTWHVGGIVRKSISESYYVMTGASLHVFTNGSGTTFGLPFAVGHEIPISDSFIIPIEFRMDVVFGDGVPIGVGGGIGLKFRFTR